MPASIELLGTSSIITKQSTLNKILHYPTNNFPKTLIKKLTAPISSDSRNLDYHYELTNDDIVKILETHCLDCQKKLLKNGFNSRYVILDNGLGEHWIKLHRKRCPQCGEISFNIDKFAPKYGNYHENYKRKSRDLAMKGFYPKQIQETFETHAQQYIPKSTIVGWINIIEEPLHELLVSTPPPSSGHWAYDEIHMRINGRKMYALIQLDLKNGAPIYITHQKVLNRATGKKLLSSARRHGSLEIKSLVKDVGITFGNLFSKRCFNNIKVQLCHVHMKWNISRYIKEACGMN